MEDEISVAKGVQAGVVEKAFWSAGVKHGSVACGTLKPGGGRVGGRLLCVREELELPSR